MKRIIEDADNSKITLAKMLYDDIEHLASNLWISKSEKCIIDINNMEIIDYIFLIIKTRENYTSYSIGLTKHSGFSIIACDNNIIAKLNYPLRVDNIQHMYFNKDAIYLKRMDSFDMETFITTEKYSDDFLLILNNKKSECIKELSIKDLKLHAIITYGNSVTCIKEMTTYYKDDKKVVYIKGMDDLIEREEIIIHKTYIPIRTRIDRLRYKTMIKLKQH